MAEYSNWQQYIRGINEQDLIKHRYDNVCAFLNKRGLKFEDLIEFASEYYNEGDTIMITSSPVYGFGTSKSDIDLILISNDNIFEAQDRTPITIVENETRVDFYRYNKSEVTTALNGFYQVISLEFDELVHHLSNWKQYISDINKKEFERIINGIMFDGTMPFITHIPALSYGWMVESYFTGIKMSIFAQLSCNSNKLNAALGYLINGMLHLMNSIVSYHGYVFSNKKHYLLGWKNLEKIIGASEIFIPINHCWNDVLSCLFEVNKNNVIDCVQQYKQFLYTIKDYTQIDLLDNLRIKQTPFETIKVMEDLYVIDGNGSRCLVRNEIKKDQFNSIQALEICQSDSLARDTLNLFKMAIYTIGV